VKKTRLAKALLFCAFVSLAVGLVCNGGAKEGPVVATPAAEGELLRLLQYPLPPRLHQYRLPRRLWPSL